MKIYSIRNMVTNEIIFKTSEQSPTRAEILEIDGHSITFQVPFVCDIWNSTYLITGSVPQPTNESSIEQPEPSNTFESTGKLTCLEKLTDSMRLRFDLLQYDRILWLKYLDHVQLKQRHADKIFRSIKGTS